MPSRAVRISTGVCTCRFRSVCRISSPLRPGSIRSSSTRSKVSALARKNPSSPVGATHHVVVLGLKRGREHLSQLPLVFDDEDAHTSHVIEVCPPKSHFPDANVREMSGEPVSAPRTIVRKDCGTIPFGRMCMRKSVLFACVVASLVGVVVRWTAAAQQQPNPRQQPGAMITMFAPEQHDLYDGHYVLSANRIHMVGGLNDPVGWDHIDNEAKTVKPVSGTAEIDVNDLTNTGKFEARLKIPEGDLVLAIDKFNEFNPCQNGGIVGFLHEHGTDSGCGDNNWPKTFVYLAGWGFGHATLNGKPLYDNYEMHFMVTQGIRDRKTLRVNYPMAEQEAAGRRGESGHAADRLLHPQPAAESEEQAEPRGVPALLRHGGHLEISRRAHS